MHANRKTGYPTWLSVAMLLCLLVTILGTGRPYVGLNMGFAWDWGGVELLPVPAMFLCEGAYNPTQGTYTPNPIAVLLPELVVDC